MKVAIVSLFSLAAILMAGSAAAEKKIVCYYTNWSIYRKGEGKFTAEDIDPTLCTHIIYSFVLAKNNRVVIHDQWTDVDSNNFNKVVGVKAKNPKVKVMMAVGGWNNGGEPFSKMAQSASTRRTFVDSALELMEKYKFDGLDLDWEYPGLRGGNPRTDKMNFNLLIQELQVAFKNYGRQKRVAKPLLSAAVGPAGKTADIAYDKATICKNLDFVNLMHYDIHGAWEKVTGFNAPLRTTQGEATPENVLDTMTQTWINAGCSRDKLIFGIPLYGRGWTTSATTVPAPATGPSKQGRFTGEAGIMGYYEICEKLSNGWKQSYNSEAEEAIAYGEGQLVTYDNERSIRAKVDYINKMNLGGAMVWTLDFDDFSGNFCNRGKYPLLSAINKQLGRSLPPTVKPPPTTTPDPSCTRWWCPSKTTTTTTKAPRKRRTTVAPRTRRTTRAPSGSCKPSCTASNYGKYMADKCDDVKFYICSDQLYEFRCGAGTVYSPSCNCCKHRR